MTDDRSHQHGTETLLDARGMRCPLPIIKMARLASTLKPGDSIRIVATDPAAEYDVPAWARLKEHLCSTPEVRDERDWEIEFVVTLVDSPKALT